MSDPVPRSSLEQLTAVQRLTLDALWDGGPGTVYDVLDRLPAGDPKPPYTSVLSALRQLEKAGWLTHDERPVGKVKQFVFAPTCSRDDARNSTVGRFVRLIFGGDAYQLAQRLLAREDLSADELAGLQKLLAERRGGAGGGPPGV